MPASSTSLTGSYRSALSSTSSLDRPYYNSSTGSYMASRASATYFNRSTSYASGGYRSRLTYDGDSGVGVRERKSTYTSEYSRRTTRAPSVSDSDSGISGVYATRSERSTSRSRDASATRSESSRTTRSDPLPRAYVSSSTADLYEKYSPANYVPLSQRLSGSVTGEAARSRLAASDTSRPPRRLRPQDAEVKIPRTHPSAPLTNPEKRHATNNASNSTTVAKPCAVVPPECATNASVQRVQELTDAANNSEPARVKRDVECTQKQRAARTTDSGLSKTRTSSSTVIPRARWSPSWSDKRSTQSHNGHALPVADDNGNDLQLSVTDIRRKFDPKMTVTKLPARDPDLLYKTAHSSDNIYGALRNLNGSSVSSLVDEKPVPVHRPITSDKYSNGTTGSLKWEFSSHSPSPNRDTKVSDSSYATKKSIEPISKDGIKNSSLNSVKSQLNANNVIGKILEKSTTIYVGNGEKNYEDTKREKSDNVLSIEVGKEQNDDSAKKTHSEGFGTEGRSKHTSDFASYIQISSPAQTSASPTGQKRFVHSACNGDANSSDDSSPDQISVAKVNGYDKQEKRTVHLLSPDEDGTNLRYIDSEPSLDSDGKLFVDYNGRDDSYEEQGFENKTFEHANGHLLRSKLNGSIKLADDLSDDEDDVRKDNDCNSNDRRARGDSGSPAPETPLAKRKYREINGESGSLYQIYQNDSLVTAKSTSPVNTLSASSSVTLNNSISTSPCGTLTTSRRRSVDSKSPQPSGEQFTKTSGLNGLRNIGNTCFMNSVVQCLSNTKPLLEYCGTPDAFAPHINTTLSCMKGALIKAFSTVITELWKADEKDGVVNTTSLKAQIQRFAPRFMGYSQQDAQEFLRYLLEGLHEDVNRVTIKPKPILTEIDENLSDAQKAEESWQRYLRSEDSKVGDIFVGQLKSSLRCTHCSHTSVTFDPFWDLSLPIPSRTGQLKLSQCLSHFVKEEELDGDEKPTCSKCQVRRKCLKWFTVQKFPRVLVLHLKRFSPTERFRGKLNVTVEFPLVGLDMTPLAASASPGARGPPPPSAIYNLYAVSNHSGTTYSGHYTAYCKHPYNGEWHEYNDSRVSPISQKNVVSSEAYVLFYELANGSASS